ncbi:MAG: dynamin family protein [Pleurocapsa sp.]
MSNTLGNNNLEQALATRNLIVNRLNRIINSIEDSDNSQNNKLGKLELKNVIADLSKCSEKLKEGIFRLLVVGDVKRGKSTVINALIGEDLLPRDVNACTAILTVLRYGIEKKVTVYFNDKTAPESLDFNTFTQKYSVSPDEAKKLENESKLAFPQVKQAVIEYPLPLLELGIEIVDSPGLNDTAARNQLSLDYIHNCNAILFILRAVQPFSLAERRYLDNYIKNRGLDVFFLINGWDEIDNSLLEPGNLEELTAAQKRSQAYFHSNLTEYIDSNKSDYLERVFPISALNALRSYLDNSTVDLESTGFNQFTNSLNTFLIEERNKAEFQQASIITQQVYNHINAAIARRIALLSTSRVDIQQKVDSISPNFVQLEELLYELELSIQELARTKAKVVADSFEEYILNLENTFELDFDKYQPQLDTLGFLNATKREDFNLGVKAGFERYLTDRLLTWEQKAEKDLDKAVEELFSSLEQYSNSYQAIISNIQIKLVGYKTIYLDKKSKIEQELDWKNWTIGCIALASGNIGGLALASVGVNRKQVIINWVSVIGISRFIAIFTGVFLNHYSVLLVSLGLAGVQTGFARQEFIRLTKQEFVQYLPKIAQEQKQTIQETVLECFDQHKKEVTKIFAKEIKGRKAELANLIQQQEITESDRTTEIERLQILDRSILSLYQEIESAVNQ